MKRYIYLIKNIGLLTISNFGTKILSFLLVPLYTNILTTSEYGTFDLFNTTVSLLIPILTLNISNAIMRFSLEKGANQTEIFSIGMRYLFKGSVLLIAFLMINSFFKLFPIIIGYEIYFFLLYEFSSFLEIVIMFARGMERISDIAIAGIVGSFLTLGSNIVFLVPLKLGLNGYFIASIIGVMGQSIFLFIKGKMYKYVKFQNDDKTLKYKMLQYSIPLIANSVAWWVNNAADRYVIVFLCGIAANGVYSIASKIPSILNIFQTIFNQAWSISAVKDFDNSDSNDFFSRTYNFYNISMTVLCSVLITLDRPIASFLYAKEFYLAWQYVPFLLIAIVFGALSGYIGGIFSAVKDSKTFAQTTVIGAIVNIIFNFILTYYLGPIGAAISTAFSYFLVWILRYYYMKKYIHISINLKRDICTYLLLLIQSIILIFNPSDTILTYLIQVIIFIMILLCYKKDIMNFCEILVRKVKKKLLKGDNK